MLQVQCFMLFDNIFGIINIMFFIQDMLRGVVYDAEVHGQRGGYQKAEPEIFPVIDLRQQPFYFHVHKLLAK